MTTLVLWEGANDNALAVIALKCKQIEALCLPQTKSTLFGILMLSAAGINLRKISLSDHKTLSFNQIASLFPTEQMFQQLEQKNPNAFNALKQLGGSLSHFEDRRFEYMNFAGCIQLDDKAMALLSQARKTLKTLSVAECHNITDRGCIALAGQGLPNLEQIFLDQCAEISPVGIHAIVRASPKLEGMSLSECLAMNDQGLQLLSQLDRNWKWIDLSYCPQITDAGLAQFLPKATNCQELSLEGCERIDDQAVRVISTHNQKLLQVNLQKCSITIMSVRWLLSHCKNLKKIGLSAGGSISSNQIAQLKISYPKLIVHCD